MSDCNLCLAGSDGDVIDVISETLVTARIPFKCGECRRLLPAKTQYEKTVGKYEGEFCTYRTCIDCVNIRQAFACNGWIYEQLWEELEGGGRNDSDALFTYFNESCVARVETASAKAYLVERWRNWKGLTRADTSERDKGTLATNKQS